MVLRVHRLLATSISDGFLGYLPKLRQPVDRVRMLIVPHGTFAWLVAPLCKFSHECARTVCPYSRLHDFLFGSAATFPCV